MSFEHAVRGHGVRVAIGSLLALIVACGSPRDEPRLPDAGLPAVQDAALADSGPSCTVIGGECREPLVTWRITQSGDVAADATHLYVVRQQEELWRLNLSTSEGELLARGGPMAKPSVHGDHVYFRWLSVEEPGRLLRVPRGGGEVEEILRANLTAYGVDAETMVYSELASSELRTMNAAGGPSNHWLGANRVGWVAARAGHVYWIDYRWSTEHGTVRRTLSHATLDLSFAETLPVEDVGAVRLGPDHVYGYVPTTGVVYRLPLDGGALEVLGETEPADVLLGPVALTDGYFYFVRVDARSLHRVPVTGGPVEDVLTGDHSVMSLAAHGANLYTVVSRRGIFRLTD